MDNKAESTSDTREHALSGYSSGLRDERNNTQTSLLYKLLSVSGNTSIKGYKEQSNTYHPVIMDVGLIPIYQNQQKTKPESHQSVEKCAVQYNEIYSYDPNIPLDLSNKKTGETGITYLNNVTRCEKMPETSHNAESYLSSSPYDGIFGENHQNCLYTKEHQPKLHLEFKHPDLTQKNECTNRQFSQYNKIYSAISNKLTGNICSYVQSHGELDRFYSMQNSTEQNHVYYGEEVRNQIQQEKLNTDKNVVTFMNKPLNTHRSEKHINMTQQNARTHPDFNKYHDIPHTNTSNEDTSYSCSQSYDVLNRVYSMQGSTGQSHIYYGQEGTHTIYETKNGNYTYNKAVSCRNKQENGQQMLNSIVQYNSSMEQKGHPSEPVATVSSFAATQQNIQDTINKHHNHIYNPYYISRTPTASNSKTRTHQILNRYIHEKSSTRKQKEFQLQPFANLMGPETQYDPSRQNDDMRSKSTTVFNYTENSGCSYNQSYGVLNRIYSMQGSTSQNLIYYGKQEIHKIQMREEKNCTYDKASTFTHEHKTTHQMLNRTAPSNSSTIEKGDTKPSCRCQMPLYDLNIMSSEQQKADTSNNCTKSCNIFNYTKNNANSFYQSYGTLNTFHSMQASSGNHHDYHTHEEGSKMWNINKKTYSNDKCCTSIDKQENMMNNIVPKNSIPLSQNDQEVIIMLEDIIDSIPFHIIDKKGKGMYKRLQSNAKQSCAFNKKEDTMINCNIHKKSQVHSLKNGRKRTASKVTQTVKRKPLL